MRRARQATICPAGDEDYYVFSGHAGERAVIDIDARVNNSALDAYLVLLDSDGTTVLAVNDDEPSGQLDSHLGYELPHDGNYYLKVREYNHPNEGGTDYFYSIRLIKDNINPYRAQITSPRTDGWLNPTQTPIAVSAADQQSGVSRVEFLWHDSNWQNPDWVWLGADYNGADGWRWNFATSSLPEQQGGAFFIWVFDWAGNWTGAGVWGLGIDRTRPTSSVLSLPAYSDLSFTVNWSGNDPMSGVANYDIQVRDGATGTWTNWMVSTTDGAAAFNGVLGHTYYFRSRARDRAGNVEAWPTTSTGDSYTEVRPNTSPEFIFADGFEGGNLAAWSSSATGGGALSVNPAAMLVGSQGLQAVINANTAMYVTDDRPNTEPRYRARFHFDPNSMSMANADIHYIFYGYSGTTTVVLRMELRFYNGSYQLRAALLDDATTWRTSSLFPISNEPHYVEFDWQAATAAGANNGSLTLWIDGVQKASLTGVDNDTRRIDRVRLGPVAGLDTGTRGTYFFDGFEARRQSYIGSASGLQVTAAAPLTATLTTTATELPTLLVTTTLQPGVRSDLAADVTGLTLQVAFPSDAVSQPATALLRTLTTDTLPDGYTLLGEMFTVQVQISS